MDRILIKKDGWERAGKSCYNFYGDLDHGIWSYLDVFRKIPTEIKTIPNIMWMECLTLKNGKIIFWPSVWIPVKGYVKLRYTESEVV